MKHSKNFKNLFFLSQKIRMIEEKIIEIYPSDKIQSPVHLSIGQESVASCLCENLEIDDWVFPTYRSHAIYIAKGGDLKKMFAELYGKKSGVAEGKAGSMHLTDPEAGVMGASAVVASSIPHAVGAAYKSKFEKNKRIYVAIFGDGAVDSGVFHESLNFCALHNLPVLFVCENNDLAVFTKRNQRQSFEITKLVESYNIKNLKIEDSWNYEKTCKTFNKSIKYVRNKKSPFFIEIDVCRYKEHVGINDDDDLGYRSLNVIKKWKKNDNLIKNKDLYESNKPKIERMINEAISFAELSKFPGKKELFKDSEYDFKNNFKVKRFYKSSNLSYRNALQKAMYHSMKLNKNSIIIGQGIDDPKKIFGTTEMLLEKFGKTRSVDTPISEEGITGVCLGMSLNKIYPIQTHIRSDFLLLASNQIINLIAKYKYMFGGLYKVPMLLRVVIGRSWGQGAQHSQSLQSLYSHIPGLKVIMPSSSQSILDSYPKIVSSFSGPVISFEHRLLYDLEFKVQEKKDFNPFSSILVKRGTDLTIVATSIMVLEAKRASEFVKKFYNINCEIIDLHCTSDIDRRKILRSVKKTKKLLVADTGWANYGVCAEINRIINESCINWLDKPVKSLSMKFTSCPTSKSLEELFYPNQIDFVKEILELLNIKQKHLPSEKSMSDVYKKFKGPF